MIVWCSKSKIPYYLHRKQLILDCSDWSPGLSLLVVKGYLCGWLTEKSWLLGTASTKHHQKVEKRRSLADGWFGWWLIRAVSAIKATHPSDISLSLFAVRWDTVDGGKVLFVRTLWWVVCLTVESSWDLGHTNTTCSHQIINILHAVVHLLLYMGRYQTGNQRRCPHITFNCSPVCCRYAHCRERRSSWSVFDGHNRLCCTK